MWEHRGRLEWRAIPVGGRPPARTGWALFRCPRPCGGSVDSLVEMLARVVVLAACLTQMMAGGEELAALSHELQRAGGDQSAVQRVEAALAETEEEGAR